MLPSDRFSEDDPAKKAILTPEFPQIPVSNLKWTSQYHQACSVSQATLEELDRKEISLPIYFSPLNTYG
jgi:hypothetical protein